MLVNQICAWLLSYVPVARLVRSSQKHGYDRMKEKNILNFGLVTRPIGGGLVSCG